MDAATQTLDLAMDAPAAFHAASCYALSCVVADPPCAANALPLRFRPISGRLSTISQKPPQSNP